jgi:hypothetical protein
MLPPQEEFVLDVRRAAGWLQKPTVLTSGAQLASGETYAKIIQQADLWLTPKVVAAYAPEHFTTLPAELQNALGQSIGEFRHVAATVRQNGPVTTEQYEKGRTAFEQVLSTVGRMVRDEWKAVVEKLTADVEQWCKGANWPTRRVDKRLDESLLGQYSLPQLELFADHHHYVLDPLARFVPAAKGAIDLSIQPSFFVTNLYRDFNDVWHIRLDVDQGTRGGRPVPLTKDSFAEAVKELGALV